jgi:hypothetical protein
MTLAFGFVLPLLIASLLGVCVIMFLTRYILGEDPIQFLQIPKSRRHAREFFISFAFGSLLCAVTCVFLRISNPDYSWRVSDLLWLVCLVVPVQSFYEEVVFRSVLQRHLLSHWFHGAVPKALLLALIFSASHFLNYRFTAGHNLHFFSLVALFFLGLSGGLIFSFQQNLSGTWGFHAGWNTLRFGVVHFMSDKPLSEAETFDQIEGSLPGVSVAVFVLGAVLVWMRSARVQIPAANADL